MKFSLLVLILVVACSKPSGSSKKTPAGPNPILNPDSIVDIADPLTTGEPQEQDDDLQQFELQQPYNGVNVILNYNSSNHVGLIRIKDKDAGKLHKHMALSTIKLDSQFVKSDIEAKVGKHVMCRQDTCWVYIDYKNGDVRENGRISETAKAPRIILPYNGKNLELHMMGRAGKISFEGMDAKALYSVMGLSEIEIGGKGSVTSRKAGEGVSCTRSVSDKADVKTIYKCEVKFNHRSGAMKDTQE